MKFEFVKETKVSGDTFYFTMIDDRFADSSLSYDYDKAKALYDNLVNNKGKYSITEVLESIEIEEAKSEA
jgi:hypothetical protein